MKNISQKTLENIVERMNGEIKPEIDEKTLEDKERKIERMIAKNKKINEKLNSAIESLKANGSVEFTLVRR